MNNFAKNVLEMEQVKDLMAKIKGEEHKKKTWIWVIVAAVAVSALVAFLVVRYFTEYDCCCEDCDCDDDFDYLDDDETDEDIEEAVEEEVLEAAQEAENVTE